MTPNNHITREKDDKPLKNMGDQWGPYFKTNQDKPILIIINTCFIFCHHVSRSLGSVWSSVQLFLLLHEVTLQGIDMTQLCNAFQW